MFTAEKDEYTSNFHVQIILDGVYDNKKIIYRNVKNAGHFSFLSPFPKSMTKVEFLPSQDPSGFNREDFHHEMNTKILDFLLREL